jgi:hypothetical protein
MCDEYCTNYGCNQSKGCPVRAQHYKPEKETSMAKKIGQFIVGAALVVFYAYMFAGTV